MTGEQSELLRTFEANYRRTHAAFNRHEFEAAFGTLPDDVEWRTLQEIPGVPEVVHGGQGVARLFREMLVEWPDWQTALDSFSEPVPGVIVVEFSIRATGRVSGIPMEDRAVQVWDLRDRPVKVTEFNDRQAARAHFGWPEEES